MRPAEAFAPRPPRSVESWRRETLQAAPSADCTKADALCPLLPELEALVVRGWPVAAYGLDSRIECRHVPSLGQNAIQALG